MATFNRIISYVTDVPVVVAPGELPTPSNFTVTPIFRGVRFAWSPTTVIKPYKWQYRFNVADDGWSAWTDLADCNTVTRVLTTDELSAHGGNANIKIAVRSTDGENYAPDADGVEADGNCDDGTLLAAQFSNDLITKTMMADDSVGTEQLVDDAVDGSKIADDAVDSKHLAAGGIDEEHLSDGCVATAKIAADAVDGSKIADDSIDSEHYADGSIDGAHLSDGCVTNAKIADDTIETGKLSATTLAMMFRSGDRTKLETALDPVGGTMTMSDLSGNDTILIARGAHKNTDDAAVISDIKSDWGLDNVENYDAADMVSNGVTSEILENNTDVIFKDGASGIAANRQVIGAINAATSDKIAVSKIDLITPGDIGLAAAGDVLDSATGYVKTGIGTGGDARSAANVAKAINGSGECIELNLSAANFTGTLDNIPDGSTYKLLTNAKDTTLGYLEGNVHTNGGNKVGLYSATRADTLAPTEAYDHVKGGTVLWTDTDISSPFDGTEVTKTLGGGSTWIEFRMLSLDMVEGYKTLKWVSEGDSGLGDGKLRMIVEDLAGVTQATGAEGSVTGAGAYVKCTCTVDISSLNDGDLYKIRVQMAGSGGETGKLRGGSLRATG